MPDQSNILTNVRSSSPVQRVALFGLISQHPGRNRGGTSFSIRRLAVYLASQGLAVDVYCHASALAQPALEGLPPQVTLVPLRPGRKLGLAVALYRELRRRPPVSVLSLDTRANQIACWVGRLPGVTCKVFVSLRNAIEDKLSGASPWQKLRLRRTFFGLYRDSDGVIAISHGLAGQFARVAGVSEERVHVIHNLVVDEGLLARAEEPVAHPWLQGGGPPVVLGVGRLAPQKDFATLLRAFARLRQRIDARLVILGQGEQEAALKALARELGVADAVDFPGFVANPAAYMRRAAVFALSSVAEGFGMALAEAMAVGCPVVSTDCPSGPSEILGDGQYGPMVPVGDDAALAAAMERLIATPPSRAALQEAARRFSVAGNGGKYQALLLGGR